MPTGQVAVTTGIGRIQVVRWRGRHVQMLLAGIERDLPRGAPLKGVGLAHLVGLTTQATPKRRLTGACTRWRGARRLRSLNVAALAGGYTETAFPARSQGLARSESFVEDLEGTVGMYTSILEYGLGGAMLRQEEPDSSAGLDAGSALVPEERGVATPCSRLQAQWHDDLVRCTQRLGWLAHRPMPTATHTVNPPQVFCLDQECS